MKELYLAGLTLNQRITLKPVLKRLSKETHISFKEAVEIFLKFYLTELEKLMK